MGKDGDPGDQSHHAQQHEEENRPPSRQTPRDPKMQAARVRLPDGVHKEFELNRGSEGEALFRLVTADLSIEEREYFSLCFYDTTEGGRHWLYNDKKILRQLKGLPWEFSFEVKFYPTTPSTLNDDHARYYLFLQLRRDILSGRLPATVATHAVLGASVAQAEFGDAPVQHDENYEHFLQTARVVPEPTPELLEKVAEFHREAKGQTTLEAENHYLDTCRQLAMYGIHLFQAKDKENGDVNIGVGASGINIYKDQLRVHRFGWQNIVKISYRRNTFQVKLKAGEVGKNEATVVYKLVDYLHAKRVWKCAVEHHTFFRLIQPEDKPKPSLFHFGSTRFRYQGRTQFQTKMASQMFDQPTAVERSQSARLTLSQENVARQSVSPLHYTDTELEHKEPVVSPAMSYEIGGVVPTSSEKRKRDEKKDKKNKKQRKGKKESDTSTSSDSEDENRQFAVVAIQKTNESSATTTAPLPVVYAPRDEDLRTVRQETREMKYRLKGEGLNSGFNPADPSLAATIAGAERLNASSPRLEHAERTFTVRATAPLPVSLEESGQPHTTVSSWQETSELPEQVVTEYDEHGNKITRTIRTSQVKHTVQKQTFQNYIVDDDQTPVGVVQVERSREQLTPLGQQGSNAGKGVVETHTRTMTYDAAGENDGGEQPGDEWGEQGLGEFVSSKTVTQGNRTIETITYKTEKDGIIETHVEHRVTIHSEAAIDHDAELSQAILEATQMNPDMTVEKIEVRQETTN